MNKEQSKYLANIHSDLSQHFVVNTRTMEWEASPSGTVWRKPLYRKGGEFRPVTSIVKYEAGGQFHTHSHPQGEEILVLEDTFEDEHGSYPQGTWIRSLHMSAHRPFSKGGCLTLCARRWLNL